MHTKNRLALRLTLSLTALASGYTLLYQLSPVQAQMTGGYTSPSMMMPPMPAGAGSPEAPMGDPSMTMPGTMMAPPMGAMPLPSDAWNAGTPPMPPQGDTGFNGAPTAGMELTPEEAKLFDELMQTIQQEQGLPYDAEMPYGDGMTPPQGAADVAAMEAKIAAMEAKIEMLEAAAAKQEAEATLTVHEAAPEEACGFFCGIWQWITGLFS